MFFFDIFVFVVVLGVVLSQYWFDFVVILVVRGGLWVTLGPAGDPRKGAKLKK